MAFLNLSGCHCNTDHITHVAESETGCCVTWANGSMTTFEGEDAAAVLKAVGAGKAKVEHKAEKGDDEPPHARSHHKAH